jgi:hypothetical protein
MATTQIGSDRLANGTALERYSDSAFMRTGNTFYFGSGPVSTNAAVGITFNASAQTIVLTGLPSVDPNLTGALWVNNNVLTLSVSH